MPADPTRTKTLRERSFIPAFTRRFRALKGAIWTTVGYENDALELRQEATAAADDVDSADSFAFRTDAGAREAFLAWLSQQIAAGVLEEITSERVRNGEHYTARYIRSAADRGWSDAAARLRKRGYDVSETELERAFDMPINADQIEMAYTRAYADLENITRAMQTAIRRELSRGLAEGVNPRVMARRLTDRVDAIGITRSKALARTEVIRNYNEFALNRYEREGVEEVGVEVEWLTAQDDRVCEECEALDGEQFAIDEARGMIPRHVNCRCAFSPAI